MREQEVATVKDLRKKHARQFDVAERILDFGYSLVVGRPVKNPGGDILVGRVLLALYAKMLANLWGIIVLAERQLPTSSTMRELTEALISLVYVVATDSSERAQLYVDSLRLRILKDVNRRLNHPDTRDTVTTAEKSAVDTLVAEIVRRRGNAIVEEMKRWQTWAGNFSLEAMALAAGLSAVVYNLAYAQDSRAAHAMDAGDYLQASPDGTLQILIPNRVEQHLIPACVAVLVAMDQISGPMGLNQANEMKAFLKEAESLA